MKERLNTLIPAAAKAEAMVSPGWPLWVLPSKVKRKVKLRSIVSPEIGSVLWLMRSFTRGVGVRLPSIGRDHLIAFHVTFSQKPESTTGAMEPPLDLLFGAVMLHVQIVGPAFVFGHRRSRAVFTAAVKL